MTTEVLGLAEALRRAGIPFEADLHLTNGTSITTSIVLPDAVGLLALKTLVRAQLTETVGANLDHATDHTLQQE